MSPQTVYPTQCKTCGETLAVANGRRYCEQHETHAVGEASLNARVYARCGAPIGKWSAKESEVTCTDPACASDGAQRRARG